MPYPPRPAAVTGPGTCTDCAARILWCLTEANRKPLAVDPAEDPTGNQAVRVDSSGIYWTRQLTKARPGAELREVLRRPHVASCEAARRRAAARRRTPGRARTGVRPVRWQR